MYPHHTYRADSNFSSIYSAIKVILTRYGESSTNPQDNFRYSSSGNRIRHLAGRHDSGEITHLAEGGTVSGTAEYVYDGNGNMTLYALRNISLTYDINNQVSTVSRNDTILSNYTYLAMCSGPIFWDHYRRSFLQKQSKNLWHKTFYNTYSRLCSHRILITLKY